MTAAATNETFSIPEGWEARLHRLSLTSSVQLCASNVLVAHLGYVGDDFAQLDHMFERVAATLGELHAPRSTRVPTEDMPLSEIFSREPPTETVTNLIVWTSFANGLDWVLRDATARSQLAWRLRELSAQQRQILVLGAPWPAEAAAANQNELAALPDVELRYSTEQFLVELKQPDGSWLACLRESVPTEKLVTLTPDDPRNAVHAPMLRAPLTQRRLSELAPAGHDQERRLSQLIEQLIRSRHPLHFFVNTERDGQLQRTPDTNREFLPLFADLTTWQRAASELGYDIQRGAAVRQALELFTWAAQSGVCIGLGHYARDSDKARYELIEPNTLARFVPGAPQPSAAVAAHAAQSPFSVWK